MPPDKTQTSLSALPMAWGFVFGHAPSFFLHGRCRLRSSQSTWFQLWYVYTQGLSKALFGVCGLRVCCWSHSISSILLSCSCRTTQCWIIVWLCFFCTTHDHCKHNSVQMLTWGVTLLQGLVLMIPSLNKFSVCSRPRQTQKHHPSPMLGQQKQILSC